ncbi:MAG: pyruvate kinase [Syntrophales bacterium]
MNGINGSDILKKSKPLDLPKTAIIATIGGPSMFQENENYLSEIIDAGATILRINLSYVKKHDDPKSPSYEHIRYIIEKANEIACQKKCLIGFLFDIFGPKIRIGEIDNPLHIERGSKIILKASDEKAISYDENGVPIIPVTYSRIANDVSVNHRVLINDGRIELKVGEVNTDNDFLLCEVMSNAVSVIKSGNGINLPDSNVSESSLTLTDEETLITLKAAQLVDEINYIGLSFVKSTDDISVLRNKCNTLMSKLPKRIGRLVIPEIISKVETWQAVKKDDQGSYITLDNIIAKSDGVMVARGDLAGETTPDEVPVIQAYISKKGNEFGKAVIIATQMLASMMTQNNTRPQRAEASDVANAVFGYVDAVMLSEETATGAIPGICVNTMREIVSKAENSQRDERRCIELPTLTPDTQRIRDLGILGNEVMVRAVAESAILFAENLNSPAIVVSTSSGDTAIRVSKYRPSQPIIAFTEIEASAKRMLLYRGIYPFFLKGYPDNIEDLISTYKNILRDIKVGDKKLIEPRNHQRIYLPMILGIQPGCDRLAAASGNTNTMYILDFE